MARYHVTPLYILKVTCLYAQLKTVITFHYCKVDRSTSYDSGGEIVTKSLD